jgi:SSS family solute:Na+ symporter
MGPTLFSPLNFVVLFAYFAAMVAIGLRLAGKQRTTEDYFLAGRRMPWLAVAMSMFASLTSAVTYMGLPALAYKENVGLIVVCVVSPLVAPVLVRVFYPFYQRLRVTTSYEYVGRRFGRTARLATSGLFILARLGWLGTVIYAPALALSVVTGLPMWGAILLMGAVATCYTTLGGISADIWTDVLQFILMIGGAVWIAVSLIHQVPDGISGIMTLARDTGRLDVFRWRGLFEMSAAIVAVSFFFQLMQDYGTDQTTVQRLMTIPTLRGTTKAILFNAVTDFLTIGLLLFIGLGLFAFHTAHADLLPDGIAGDRLLPYYIIHAMPNGVSGLLIAAIFAAAMSSMDSGINSLSTVLVNDFIRPFRRVLRGEAHDLKLARTLTLAFGAFGTGVAFFVSTFDHIIEAYTTIISLFNGPILAMFLLGIFVPRARFAGWVAGAAVSIPATLWLQYVVKAHWIFYFPFSFLVAMGVGTLVSLMLPRKPVPEGLTLW